MFSKRKLKQIEEVVEKVVRRVGPDLIAEAVQKVEDGEFGGATPTPGGDGSWDEEALYSSIQLVRRDVLGRNVVLSNEVLLFAKTTAEQVRDGIMTMKQVQDMPGAQLDGDEIYDFMVANPQHYGTDWQGVEGNERPTYDD